MVYSLTQVAYSDIITHYIKLTSYGTLLNWRPTALYKTDFLRHYIKLTSYRVILN